MCCYSQETPHARLPHLEASARQSTLAEPCQRCTDESIRQINAPFYFRVWKQQLVGGGEIDAPLSCSYSPFEKMAVLLFGAGFVCDVVTGYKLNFFI